MFSRLLKIFTHKKEKLKLEKPFLRLYGHNNSNNIHKDDFYLYTPVHGFEIIKQMFSQIKSGYFQQKKK